LIDRNADGAGCGIRFLTGVDCGSCETHKGQQTQELTIKSEEVRDSDSSLRMNLVSIHRDSNSHDFIAPQHLFPYHRESVIISGIKYLLNSGSLRSAFATRITKSLEDL
jgi:hypothetical protein